MAKPVKTAQDLVDTQCTCGRLRRTARCMTQCYETALKPTGLTISQYQILAHTAHSKALSITALAAIIAVDRTTLTRNLRPLENTGLIAVVDGPDRRSRAVELTPAGQLKYQQGLVCWGAAQAALEQHLGSARTAALHELLDQAFVEASNVSF